MSAFLLDVNALIALLDEQHVHHIYVHDWFASLTDEKRWATCPLTINGFVRIFGSARYKGPGTVAAAAIVLDQACAVEAHEFWPDDISLLDVGVFNREQLAGSDGITDAYLLALAMKHNGSLVTFDRTIRLEGVIGAEPRHLTLLG